jgi:outer membrane protein assembly factor BamE (lipoprotein component of BamABCDE complex)
MGRAGWALRQVALVVVSIVLIACSPVYRNHGYIPSDTDLEQIVVGTSTREDVALDVGRPSSSGVLAGAAWYYVGSQFKHFGIRAPQEVGRQVVAISFGEDGTVSNIERFGLEDGRVITLSRRVTDSGISSVGFLRQLLGNLGNFNAGQILGPEN